MIKKISLLLNTVKYLKPKQIFNQLKYRLNKPGSLCRYYKGCASKEVCLLSFNTLPPVYPSYSGKNEFVFLNQKVEFGTQVDWNYQKNGKLWNYNLQYANWLLQADVSYDEKIRLLTSLYEWLNNGQLPVEPYPVSLRAVNVMRFFSCENKTDDKILANLHAELDFLSKRPEYHLLGNHLLENAFALIMGGAFFLKDQWIKQGKSILEKELEEQILSDGAHFELSPMYHQIILFRLLELIDWYSTWILKDKSFEIYLKKKASLMLTWLRNISFESGDIPHFSDSTDGIAYATNWLMKYGEELEIKPYEINLGTSGYRSIKKLKYECKIDFAQIGPSYQPGHAHADTLSFILYYKNNPLFVEQGTSTYQISDRRLHERSTLSHNTVVIDNSNQSNVWSGFRVAQRAKTKITKEGDDSMEAEHDGYKNVGIIHKRLFHFHENKIQIHDYAFGNNEVKKEFHLHIAPGLRVAQTNNSIIIEDIATIVFIGNSAIRIEKYEMADGFNKYNAGKKIVVNFVNHLFSEIVFN